MQSGPILPSSGSLHRSEPAWDEVRGRAQRKAIEMRSQGWSGAAMLPYSELEYGGFRDTVSALLKRFRLREERKPEAAE
jgi:fructose 1,6-bisphosphate aldolase/phosphatase